MNDVTDILEIFLENQKRKHINQGALGALGLVLISMIMNNRQNSENNQLFNISETSPENATSADGLSQGASGPKTECAGTYPVSGYTRADGTEVSAYTRSCGAAHNGNSNSKSEHIEELDYYAENEGYDVLEGHVDKSHFLEKAKNILHENSEIYKNYENLEPKEILQKTIAKNIFKNSTNPLFEYYKISLDLADNPNKVISNDRYSVYKMENLPSTINRKIIYEKYVNGNSNSKENSAEINDIRVIVPNENSELIKFIKKSDEIKDILKKEANNIENGLYKDKYFKNGIEFKKPVSNDYLSEHWNEKATLFGVLHNVDIYDMKQNAFGDTSFIITDFYDFDNWNLRNQNYENWLVESLNNNAYWQQETDNLMPYILYIPVKISKKEKQELLHN